MLDREIKVAPKMEKRLIYLGFEEKNLNIKGLPNYQVLKRYFVHPSGWQVRVNLKSKTLTIIDPKGFPQGDDYEGIKSSYLKKLTNEST